MDSMVNHYTAARRRRSDDAYTPGGRHGARPDYPTIIYSAILRDLFPDTPYNSRRHRGVDAPAFTL